MTVISSVPLYPLRDVQSERTGMHSTGEVSSGLDLVRTAATSAVTKDGGPWLKNHSLAGSSAFWAQLLGQMLPQENPLQPAVILKAHVSYAVLLTPYGSETFEFFSPNALDKDRSFDLYT